MVPMMTGSVGLHLLLGYKIQELGGEKDIKEDSIGSGKRRLTLVTYRCNVSGVR